MTAPPPTPTLPELSPRRLLAAYASGAFPMPDPDGAGRVLWFSPDPRGLLPLDERFHVPRRLRRTIRQGRFTCTVDRAFGAVIRSCADRAEGTWITGDFLAAYTRLHALGVAHSVEAWSADPAPPARGESLAEPARGESVVEPACGELVVEPARGESVVEPVGGVYGVALGGAFFAESMFHRRRDAGKVALVYLIEHLRRRGFVLCDVQWLTPHLERFGAWPVPAIDYLGMLAEALSAPVTFADAG